MGNENNDEFGYTLRRRCDPFHLGMNRHMADPCFDVRNCYLRDDLEKEAEEPDWDRQNPDRHMGTKAHWETSLRLHFGLTADSPGIATHWDHNTIAGTLSNCMKIMIDQWSDLFLIVYEHEVVIQEHIKSLSQQQLKEYLIGAWGSAKKVFNFTRAREQDRPRDRSRNRSKNEKRLQQAFAGEKVDQNHWPIGSQYHLDQTDMPDFHAPDLDNFTVDFLRDQLDSIKKDRAEPNDDILVPLYRTGCNYRNVRIRITDGAGKHKEELLQMKEGGVSYNSNFSHLDMVRSSYLAPHINLQDLMVPENLLRFIHYRARVQPRDFAANDNIMTYTGRQSKIVSGPLVANRMFACIANDGHSVWYKGYGGDPDPTFNKMNEHQEFYRSGQLFGPSEFFLIMKSQTLTYAFLKSLCFIITDELGLRPKATIAAELDPSDKAQARREEVEKIARQNLQCTTPWPDKATLAQYEPRAPGIKVELFAARLGSRFTEAKQHISKLFDDPDYFAETMIQEREHHWHNVPAESGALRIDEYLDTEKRHGLYIECLRRVSKRALFEVFLWNTTKLKLEAFNQNVLTDHPKSDQGFDRLGVFSRWPGPPSLFNEERPNERGPLLLKFMELVALIRYNAIFFLNEFRVAAIHASSEPFRGEFVRKGTRKDVDIKKGHYHSVPTHVARRTKAYDKDEDDKDLLLDLIDTFIADEGASMHIGIHKVTERLQFLLDDPKDTTWKYVTKHVASTIGKLHLLAELADHLERWAPITELLCALTEDDRRRYFRQATEGISIDLFNFDSFEIDDDGKCIPSKRINRLCSFLDEVQQFGPEKTRSLGVARGDLKRYACSLLTQYIEVIDERSTYRAGEEVLKGLEEQMGFNRNKYPFEQDEEPINIGPGALTYKIAGGLSVPKHQIDPQGKFKDEASDWKRKAKGKRPASKAFGKVTDERNREEIVERRRVKMQARLQRVRDKWDRENEEHRRRMAAAAARPGRPQPRPRTQHRPPPVPSIPLAPDGQPKRELKRVDWDNLAGLFNVDGASPPSFEGIELTLEHIGYKHSAGQGSHSKCKFTRTNERCRWPKSSLPKGTSFTWSETHGKKKSRVNKNKARTWAGIVAQQGFTWEFINDWHYGYE